MGIASFNTTQRVHLRVASRTRICVCAKTTGAAVDCRYRRMRMATLASTLECSSILTRFLEYTDLASLMVTCKDHRNVVTRLGLVFAAAADSGRRHMMHCIANTYSVLSIVWKAWTVHVLHQLCPTCVSSFGATHRRTQTCRLLPWLDQCPHPHHDV